MASRRQYAALPVATVGEGQTLVLLLTSRESRRWVIPKGWAEKGVAPHRLAQREAFEEAGVRGEIGHEPIGTFRYTKLLRGKRRTRTVSCEVAVFELRVEYLLDDWPEKGQRERRWIAPLEAAELVEDGLAGLLRDLAARPAAMDRSTLQQPSPGHLAANPTT
jgi:8-oxo-dGTP pyrophosphatase MutT (NUDIX family)